MAAALRARTAGAKVVIANSTKTQARPAIRRAAKIDLLSLIDRHNPEQQLIAFAILKARQKRKAGEATERKRGAK